MLMLMLMLPWRQMARFLRAGSSHTRGSTAWAHHCDQFETLETFWRWTSWCRVSTKIMKSQWEKKYIPMLNLNTEDDGWCLMILNLNKEDYDCKVGGKIEETVSLLEHRRHSWIFLIDHHTNHHTNHHHHHHTNHHHHSWPCVWFVKRKLSPQKAAAAVRY